VEGGGYPGGCHGNVASHGVAFLHPVALHPYLCYTGIMAEHYVHVPEGVFLRKNFHSMVVSPLELTPEQRQELEEAGEEVPEAPFSLTIRLTDGPGIIVTGSRGEMHGLYRFVLQQMGAPEFNIVKKPPVGEEDPRGEQDMMEGGEQKPAKLHLAYDSAQEQEDEDADQTGE
jgi:hypothetical protein